MGMGKYAGKHANTSEMDMNYQSEDYYKNQAGGTMTARGSKQRPPSYGKERYPGKNEVEGNSAHDKY